MPTRKSAPAPESNPAPPAPPARPGVGIGPPVLDYPPPGARPVPPAPSAQAITPMNTEMFAGLVDRVAAKVLAAQAAGGRQVVRVSGALHTGALRAQRAPGWFHALLAAAALLVLWQAALLLAGLLADPLASLQYGTPRTTHLSGFVGAPGETSASPTLITAVNDGGIGHIYILPAGDPNKAQVITQDLSSADPRGRLPLRLALADADRDRYPDLLVTVGQEVAVYLWDTGKAAFRAPTPDELRRLTLPDEGR